jgi:Legume lectin domain/Bacterial lectin
VDRLAAFVHATGWQCLYGVNLAGASTGATTPALAAAEIAYAAQQLGSSLVGVEMGNEPNLWGSPGDFFAGNWSLTQYESLWDEFRSAIVAANPGVAITGPGCIGAETTWTVPFGEWATSSKVSLLTQHYYRDDADAAGSTPAHLISSNPTLIADLAALQAGSQELGIPYRFSECNSYYTEGTPPPGISDAYCSSLWSIDFLFQCASFGCSGVSFQAGEDGPDYTPIADSNGVVVEARPEYYGLLLFSLAGQGTLYQSTVKAGSLNVTGYAVASATGVNIVVVNKDVTNLQMTLQLPRSVSTATLIQMTQLSPGASGPNLSATSGVTIQGATVNPDGTFSPAAPYNLSTNGPQVTCYVPALSAVLIQTSPGVQPPNQPFDYSAGFAQNQETLQFNGNAALSGNLLQLTDGGINEASSVFYGSPLSVQSFTTDFTFQLTNTAADGFTFTIQNAGPGALGAHGGSLGYAGIGSSVAIKFDFHKNAGDPSDNCTGIFTDGAAPYGGIDLTGTGIDLHSGDTMDAHISYDGTTLNLTITDLVTQATWSQAFTINIPAMVGGATAYFGFTAGTGSTSAIQQILSWSYEAGPVPYEPTGFASGAPMAINGSASISGTSLILTNGGLHQAASAFFTAPQNIQSFTTDFKFQLTNPAADGFTFTIQNAGPTALGADGSSLGYAGIRDSVAVKFDIHQNPGDPSNNCTGIFVDGDAPIGPTSIDLTGTGINLRSGDEMEANITYDGQRLTLTITDLVTLASWSSQGFVINIPAIVGGNTAYVGFTAGTGSSSSTQRILSWTFE